jgi:PIN domain nuclease of toxin-antitoxin system
MVTFVLDASALIRYIENQAGADRVAEILVTHTSKTAQVVMSAVNWGEVTTMLLREHGPSGAEKARSGLMDLRLEIIPATA